MVTVNGNSENAEGKTILQFLNEKGYNPDTVVVERNLEILEKNNLDKTIIAEGDVIEILRFMGGGSTTFIKRR